MLYRYMAEHEREFLENFQVVWSIQGENEKQARELLESVADYSEFKICKKKSIAGLWTLCRSKYIITTHNYITGIKSHGDQKHYNL